MFNVCPRCGEYSVEKAIDSNGPFAICPFCQYAHPFLRQPLFLITGPSGAGKTTVCLELVALLRDECVVLESDILWGAFPATEENGYQEYRNMWLRMAKNIGQAGRPVVLCGTVLPEQCERCPERRYFSTLHYLSLVCEDDLLVERLKQRPAWRGTNNGDVVQRMVQFNRWLKEHAATTNPPITLYDTSQRSLQETTCTIAQWIRERL
ncbi:MAG TPA: AAA family ATPase [Ktedonobacteraceae bacterium]|jgi:predicted ABC-type ATPase|nr:AAA family ATPase [Ktedonobacteraceae bacterium]